RVGAVVDRVDVDILSRHLLRPVQPAEARRPITRGHLRLARVAAQVDVDLTGVALEPDEADQVAALRGDGVHSLPPAADLPRERIGQPARAVHGRVDPVGELLPPGLPRWRTR